MSGKPIEYVNGKPILDLIQKMGAFNNKKKNKKINSVGSPNSRRKATNSIGRKRGLTFSKESRKNETKRTSSMKNFSSLTESKSSGIFPIVLSDGSIACDSNFSSFLFCDVFVSVSMREVLDDKHYLLISGVFSDLLHYCILHAHPKQFRTSSSNTKTYSFLFFLSTLIL